MTTHWRTGSASETIARATFDGFLQSDLMPSGMQAPAIIWAAAFLVAPSLLLPAAQHRQVPVASARFRPDLVEAAFWSDRLLFLLMSAGAVGLVSVVLWDTLFPARRDAFVLTPMPVSLPVQMLGRLAGLLMLCVVFVVGAERDSGHRVSRCVVRGQFVADAARRSSAHARRRRPRRTSSSSSA